MFVPGLPIIDCIAKWKLSSLSCRQVNAYLFYLMLGSHKTRHQYSFDSWEIHIRNRADMELNLFYFSAKTFHEVHPSMTNNLVMPTTVVCAWR